MPVMQRQRLLGSQHSGFSFTAPVTLYCNNFFTFLYSSSSSLRLNSVVAGQHWSLLYLQGLLTDGDVGGRDLLLSDYLPPGKPWVGGVPLSSAEPRYPCPQHSYRGFLPHHKAPSSGSETQERRGQRGPAQLAWVMTQNSTSATKSRSNNRSYCHPDGDGDALALDGQSLSPFMDVRRGH